MERDAHSLAHLLPFLFLFLFLRRRSGSLELRVVGFVADSCAPSLDLPVCFHSGLETDCGV